MAVVKMGTVRKGTVKTGTVKTGTVKMAAMSVRDEMGMRSGWWVGGRIPQLVVEAARRV